jgi:hypothetical protein
MLDVEDVAMKPTCPTACPLKQKIDEHKQGEAALDEIRWMMEQASPFERFRMLTVATFAYYKYKGFAKLSTWIEMFERQRVLYFIWGFFERIDTAMIRGR